MGFWLSGTRNNALSRPIAIRLPRGFPCPTMWQLRFLDPRAAEAELREDDGVSVHGLRGQPSK